jgi:hypothetical protein
MGAEFILNIWKAGANITAYDTYFVFVKKRPTPYADYLIVKNTIDQVRVSNSAPKVMTHDPEGEAEEAAL